MTTASEVFSALFLNQVYEFMEIGKMTKLKNSLVIIISAFCLAVCAGLFVACGNNQNPSDNSVAYTVTVKHDGVRGRGRIGKTQYLVFT